MRPVEVDSGRPLAVLGMILGLWIAVRVLMWESPFPAVQPDLVEFNFKGPSLTVVSPPGAAGSGQGDRAAQSAVAAASLPADAAWMMQAPAGLPGPAAAQPASFFDAAAMASRGAPFDEGTSQQLMWLAAYDDEEGDPEEAAGAGAGAVSGAGAQFAPYALARKSPPARGAGADRWSLSAWVFLREGRSGAIPAGASIPVYGASQAGVLAQYRLAPGAARDPAVYLRATSALQRRDERELAAGLSLRPLAAVPVALLAEGRWRDGVAGVGGGDTFRPAVLLVSQLPAQAIGPRILAETYVQAGYVGGRRNKGGATAFADGQLRLTADVARFDLGAVRAGAGAWGGAQRGAARIDAGPTAQLDLSLGQVPARVAVDYRVRLAGDAQPGSGLAVTLSTGF